MPATVHIKQLEGIIDAMVENGDRAADILDACLEAICESCDVQGKQVPEKIRKLDVFRLT